MKMNENRIRSTDLFLGGAFSENVFSPEAWPKNLLTSVWRPGCYVRAKGSLFLKGDSCFIVLFGAKGAVGYFAQLRSFFLTAIFSYPV